MVPQASFRSCGNSAIPFRARAEFDAKSEKLLARNEVDFKVNFVLRWKDSPGKIHTALNKWVAAEGAQSWKLSLPEDAGVTLAVGDNDAKAGQAGMTTLRD
ncbi:hypothetical protein [Streptomyces lydicus]|uniref:hypothetical protein n=1 Tax=Streptomyces lydicus TaxID=47763 RepID=UPI0037A82EF4